MVEGGGDRPARRQQTVINVQLNLKETITHLLIGVSGLPCGGDGVNWFVVNTGICGTAVR